MKKIVVLFIMALVAIGSFGQSVVRTGNTYYADNQMMKKGTFAAYMQENAEANLSAQFQSGLSLSNTGWWLFGCGVGAIVTGAAVSIAYMMPYMAESMVATVVNTSDSQTPKAAYAGYVAGGTLAIAGYCCTISGIVCLGVGYSRMHQSADSYAYSHNKSQDQAYLTLQTSQDGIGLALHF